MILKLNKDDYYAYTAAGYIIAVQAVQINCSYIGTGHPYNQVDEFS